jgi:hypothetical protein
MAALVCWFAARNIHLTKKYYGRNKGLNPSFPIMPEFFRSEAKRSSTSIYICNNNRKCEL